MTRCLVSSETLAPGVKVRETAERDTPASSATCLALAKALRVLLWSMDAEGRVPCRRILHGGGAADKIVHRRRAPEPGTRTGAIDSRDKVQHSCTGVQRRLPRREETGPKKEEAP